VEKVASHEDAQEREPADPGFAAPVRAMDGRQGADECLGRDDPRVQAATVVPARPELATMQMPHTMKDGLSVLRYREECDVADAKIVIGARSDVDEVAGADDGPHAGTLIGRTARERRRVRCGRGHE